MHLFKYVLTVICKADSTKEKTNKKPEGYFLIDLESAWIAVFKN